jgi:ribosome-binding protein aMBF1 (putative translation factor)
MRQKKKRAPETGHYRRGDEHPAAVLTDAEVDLVRELHESGWPYSALADKFEVSKSAIAGICQCRRRRA